MERHQDPRGHSRDGVRIDVADTGEGIPPEHLDTIFQPFVSTHRNNQNLGLGLALVQRLMTENEGRVTVVSEMGKGTTFSLWIPKATASLDRPPVPETPLSFRP